MTTTTSLLLLLACLRASAVYIDDGYFDPSQIRPEHLSSNRYFQTPSANMRGTLISEEETFRRRLQGDEYDTDSGSSSGVEQLENCGSETDRGESYSRGSIIIRQRCSMMNSP